MRAERAAVTKRAGRQHLCRALRLPNERETQAPAVAGAESEREESSVQVVHKFIHLVLLITMPPLLPGIIGKTKAVFAGRVGPPVLQTYYDLIKLFQKGSVISTTTFGRLTADELWAGLAEPVSVAPATTPAARAAMTNHPFHPAIAGVFPGPVKHLLAACESFLRDAEVALKSSTGLADSDKCCDSAAVPCPLDCLRRCGADHARQRGRRREPAGRIPSDDSRLRRPQDGPSAPRQDRRALPQERTPDLLERSRPGRAGRVDRGPGAGRPHRSARSSRPQGLELARHMGSSQAVLRRRRGRVPGQRVHLRLRQHR